MRGIISAAVMDFTKLDYASTRYRCDHGLYGQDEIDKGICNDIREYRIGWDYPVLDHSFIESVCILWFVTVGCATFLASRWIRRR